MRYLIFIGLITLICSCVGELDRNEFATWMRDYDNGLHVKKTLAPFDFDVQYQPYAYMILKQNPEITADALAKELETAPALQHYVLNIGLSDRSGDFIKGISASPEDMQRTLYYFSYGFEKDIYLKEGDQEFPCVMFHFEKAGDVKGARTFVLGFENKATESETATLMIKSPIFGNAPVLIDIKKNNIPRLKI